MLPRATAQSTRTSEPSGAVASASAAARLMQKSTIAMMPCSNFGSTRANSVRLTRLQWFDMRRDYLAVLVARRHVMAADRLAEMHRYRYQNRRQQRHAGQRQP